MCECFKIFVKEWKTLSQKLEQNETEFISKK